MHKLLLQFLYSQCTTVSAVSVLTADYTATDYYNVPIECIHVLRIFLFLNYIIFMYVRVFAVNTYNRKKVRIVIKAQVMNTRVLVIFFLASLKVCKHI